ncbi:MAG: FecR family protein [Prevotella sp.]|jgi:ferric-dicitrate binding protein FerR (iron transport regulator)|nr:FecR family protein [Prevotella sp.]
MNKRKNALATEQLIKYIEGNSTQNEKDVIVRWLDSDEKNWKEFMALRKSYDLTLANLEDRLPEIPQIKPKKKGIAYELLKIAAIFILAFGCYYLLEKTTRQPEDEVVMHTFHVPAGQRAELTLADGTNVWLNAKTTLTFPSHFTKSGREVQLDGEAYFTVKPDPANTFTVNTRQYAIKVLGTEFDVSAYSTSETFETSLIKGTVEISSSKTNESVKLSPNNRVYIENGKLVQAPIRYYSHFLWKDGMISFENERMESIIDKLRLYYDVNIQVKNKEISDLRYTGKFWTKDGVEHVIRVLRIHAKFQYIKDHEQNLITIY